MTANEIEALIDKRFAEEAGKALKGDKRGPMSMLYDEPFRRVFVQAVAEHGENGGQVFHSIFYDHNVDVSYRAIQKYMRWRFGGYKQMGRPPKYLKQQGRK